MLATQYASIQKEVKFNPKQPSCKKCVLPQEGHCEKRCEIQSGSQEMQLMEKNLITTIQVNLCYFLHASL